MACLSKTRAAFDTMTASERKLAKLIFDEPQYVIHGTSKTIGERCGISAPSVVRFAQRLGYASLREMKNDLRDDLEQNVDDAPEQPNNCSDLHELLPYFTTQLTMGVQMAMGMQNLDDMEQAVRMIHEAETVYLYGIGASALPVLDLQQKLLRVNKRAIYRTDQKLGKLDAFHMTASDLIIAFSHSGVHAEMNEAVCEATSRGAKCIAITRFGRSPLASFATLTLPLPENEPFLMSYASAQSKYSSLQIADLLFARYLNCLDEEAVETFHKIGGLLQI